MKKPAGFVLVGFLFVLSILSPLAAASLRKPDYPLSKPLPFVPSLKRGVGHWASGDDEDGLPDTVVDDLHLAWFYDWVGYPHSRKKKPQAEFVPMIWSHIHLRELSRVKEYGSVLLGFNEPDGNDQANMSVEECLNDWPNLEKTGLRLGSPAPADSDWLDDFMAGAAKRGYRVDFLALHRYPDLVNLDAAEEIRGLVRRFWNKYHKPIWLTEYSGPNLMFAGFSGKATMANNAQFARDSCLVLESLPYVERYAWFSTGPGAHDSTRGDGYAPTPLYIKRGELAPAGIAYRDAMLRPDLGLQYSISSRGKVPAQGKVVGLDLWADDTEGDAQVVFSGRFEARLAGTYAFTLFDEGSSVWVGGRQVAAADKDSGRGVVGLEAGQHRIEIRAVRKGDHPRLRVALEGPDIPFQSIPLDLLFLP
jgi:hypothetical protein